MFDLFFTVPSNLSKKLIITITNESSYVIIIKVFSIMQPCELKGIDNFIENVLYHYSFVKYMYLGGKITYIFCLYLPFQIPLPFSVVY